LRTDPASSSPVGGGLGLDVGANCDIVYLCLFRFRSGRSSLVKGGMFRDEFRQKVRACIGYREETAGLTRIQQGGTSKYMHSIGRR
jgi:hypothetical protein